MKPFLLLLGVGLALLTGCATTKPTLDAGAAAQAEEAWKKNAVQGVPLAGEGESRSVRRSHYVPSQTVNGVTYPGHFQSTNIYD